MPILNEKTQVTYTRKVPIIQVVVANIEKEFSEKELTVGECRVILEMLKDHLERKILEVTVDFEK